jgi:PAS domain S-box-containing protein
VSSEKEGSSANLGIADALPEGDCVEGTELPDGLTEYLATATRNTSNKVLFLDADGHIQWVNMAFTSLYGYTLGEVAGKKPDVLHGPLSDARTTARIRMAVLQRKAFKEEVVHYTKSGAERWMLASGQPLTNRQGNVVKYLVVHTDITELKQKEAKLHQAALRLETLINTTNSPHLFFDRQLRLQAYNKAACELAKFAGVSLRRGKTLDQLTRVVTGEDFAGFCQLALSGTNTLNREVELVKGELWMLVSYIAARDCFGNILGITFSALDITARKLSETKLYKQELVLNDIAWKQSHLVRAPLANILCIVNLLQLDAGDQTLLQHLQREGERLDKVIRDIVLQSSNVHQ